MSCCPRYLGVCGISQCQVQQPGRCNEPGCRGPQWWQHPATLAPSSSSCCCCCWWTRSSARMTPGRTSTWSPCLLGRRVSSEVWGSDCLLVVCRRARGGGRHPRAGGGEDALAADPAGRHAVLRDRRWGTRGSGHAARGAWLCRSLLHGGARLRTDDRGGGVAEPAVDGGGEVSSRASNEGPHEGL